MESTQTLKGRCHCGNISFQFNTGLSIPDIGIRRCDCSFCSKTGARYLSDPNGELLIHIENKQLVTPYLFGTKTAMFSICSICGCIPLATSQIDGSTYGIINVNALDDIEPFGRHAQVMNYDDESFEERLSRRKEKWIGTVKYL